MGGDIGAMLELRYTLLKAPLILSVCRDYTSSIREDVLQMLLFMD